MTSQVTHNGPKSWRWTFGVRPDGGEQVTLAGKDVTAELRSETAGAGASRVAAWPQARAALYWPASRLCPAPRPGGRRTGHGDAWYSRPPTSRSSSPPAPRRGPSRRYKQLKDKGSGASLAALSREIAERDRRDSTRAVAPLKPAPDADVIDTTGSRHRAGRRAGCWPVGASKRTLEVAREGMSVGSSANRRCPVCSTRRATASIDLPGSQDAESSTA